MGRGCQNLTKLRIACKGVAWTQLILNEFKLWAFVNNVMNLIFPLKLINYHIFMELVN